MYLSNIVKIIAFTYIGIEIFRNWSESVCMYVRTCVY